ncbi:MAG: DUF2076 domain-containing protein [Pseudorhodoplanes sp.]|nr:DUF2076 domain-containing protein [Pseudorhodoplanes sp.]
MTPQERQLVADLFDRLTRLEEVARDPEAERAINDGLRGAPNAVYALVQTVLIQDEALRQADARIRELENGTATGGSGSFLDSMRGALFGQTGERRGSVPSVRGGMETPPPYQREQPAAGGGSFLGTAAAAAAGVIGGALLLNSFRSMFGGGQHQGALDSAGAGGMPWSNPDSSLSREAGVPDIGRGSGGERQGLFQNASYENDGDADDDEDYDDDDGGDFGDGGD